MTASKIDPRLALIAKILEDCDAWVSSKGADQPCESAAVLAAQVIDFLLSSGLSKPFDYLVQDEMRCGFDNPPPDSIEEQERAILRGKARMTDFIVKILPDAYPPPLAAALVADAWLAASGEQPLLGREIPFKNRQQDRPTMARTMLTRAIRWAYYASAKDNTKGGWSAKFIETFGLYKQNTLEEYKGLVPQEERQLCRDTGLATRAGKALTREQLDTKSELTRISINELRDALAETVRGNIWRLRV